ncbi:HAT dimerization, partial [Trametes versicolor FP-101664 SS1]
DELNDYLESPVDPTKDALAWWHARRLQFPRLSRMALDYLSIPATSVDVERTFSRGRRLLSHVRSRLSAQTTRAVLCLSDWVRWDLVKSQDI